MKRALAAALLGATLLNAAAAHAAVEPARAGKNGDPRIRSVAYNAKQVLKVASTGLVPVQLLFEPGEHPVTITGALVAMDAKEAKDWFAQKSGNALILQPLHTMQPSFLFVRTVAAGGEERHYVLELGTRDGDPTSGTDPDAYVEVDFIYKHRPTPEEVAAWRARRDAAVHAASERGAAVRLAQARAAAPRNLDYWRRDPVGCPELAPLRVWDDGHQTTMVFAPHGKLPSLFAINPDNKESIVTTISEATPEGTQVIAPNVYREVRLRWGGKVCALRNNAYDAVGTPIGGGTGTISPDVVREVRTP